MVALARDLKWSTLLSEVTEQGAAFAARAIDQPCCAQLAAELGGGPYEPVVPVIGQVRQQAEAFEVAVEQLHRRYPVLAELCGELVGQVQRHGVPGWVPNEVAIQRYQPGSLGITPHRDQRRFAQLLPWSRLPGRRRSPCVATDPATRSTRGRPTRAASFCCEGPGWSVTRMGGPCTWSVAPPVSRALRSESACPPPNAAPQFVG